MTVVVAGVTAACAGSSPAAAHSARCEQNAPGRRLELIDAHTGAIDASFPDVDGNVYSAIADGRGGWFVAGDFRCVGAVPTRPLARLNADGTLDGSWHPAVLSTTIQTIRLVGDRLYAAGRFGVDALDARTGRRLWRTVANANGAAGVQAVAADAQRVYIGGTFTTVAGQKHAAIAVLDARTGKPLAWQALALSTWPTLAPTPGEPSVEALALWAGRLYVGGDMIAAVDGQKRPAIAVLSARSGKLLPWLPPFRHGLSVIGDVGTIMVAGGRVFTAGHDGFGITNARTGKLDPLWARAGGYVFASHGDMAYLAGDCRNSFASFEVKPRNNLAQIDLRTGHATSWSPNLATYVCTESIAASADRVLVTGYFGDTLG